MPYGIRKRGSKWVVVKLAEGRQPERTMGVHDTRQAAVPQRPDACHARPWCAPVGGPQRA